MKLAEVIIAYNPGTDQIRVGPLLHLSDDDWTKGMRFTAGAAFVEVRSMNETQSRLRVMSDFIGIVVRDGVNIKAAHSEFLKIDEYVKSIPVDMLPPNHGEPT